MEGVRYKRGISQVLEDPQTSGRDDNGAGQSAKTRRTSLGGDAELMTSSEPSSKALKALQAMDALEEQLICDMCAGLFIQPVSLSGCGHTFCGSCLMFWISSNIYQKQRDNLEWTCPTCRHGPLTTALPSIVVRNLCDIFLQYRPELARHEDEAGRAAQIYKGAKITFPDQTLQVPKETRIDVYEPCDWCDFDDDFEDGDFHCLIPVPVGDYAVLKTGPTPEGHFLCSQCECLGPIDGPDTVACNLCFELRCRRSEDTCWTPQASLAAPLDHHREGRREPASYYGERYWKNQVECRHANTVFDILHGDEKAIVIYNEIYDWTKSPHGQATGGFASLLAPYAEAIRLPFVKDFKMTQPDGESSRICSDCCEHIIGAGLFGWLRRTLDGLRGDIHPELAQIKARPRCPHGFTCIRQYRSISHAESFSHIDPANENAPIESNEDAIESSDVPVPHEPTYRRVP